ncbi:MAG: VTT domain-containing protein [Candidatus Nomurabacteria bacterium]|jgi:membrane-associated protein|nr:VTT domain-containing protein [Candidatus Nomurabacteria bacterium]
MIPGIDLQTVLSAMGYLVPLIIFAETGLMIGFFLPGDTLLFTAGALTGIGVLDVNPYILAALFFVAAVAGNTTGHLIGRHAGRRLFRKKDSRIFKQKHLQEAEKFYEKSGAKAVIFAQFIPILRTFNPIVSGISKMNYVKFITYNIIGALIWTVGFTLGGYFLFKTFGQLIDPETIDSYILPIIILILILSFLPAIIHVLQNPERRAIIKQKFNNLIKRGNSNKEEYVKGKN